MTEQKNTQFCKKCGKEIASEAVICPGCGTEMKEKIAKPPFYKKWWFWVIIVIAALFIAGGSSEDSDKTPDNSTSNNNVAEEVQEPEQIEYTAYQVSELIDDLKNNALSAEKKYSDQYVELTGKLANIDSDGSYISLEPTNNNFSFINIQCFIQNEEQINQILELSKGDILTVRGKITEVGEVLGYQLKIDSIN